MSKFFRVAILSFSILTLSACGGGGDSSEENGEAPAPATSDSVASDPVTPDPVTPDPVTPDPVTPDPVTPDPVTPDPVTPDPVTPDPAVDDSAKVKNQSEASRFLNRATFGPTQDSINQLLGKSTYQNWINDQFNTAATYHLPQVQSLGKRMCANINDDGSTRVDSWEYRFPRHHVWWEAATKADDQLRQRVALALSEILVISDSDGLGLSEYHLAVSSYYDVLIKHAFGNYRDLLEEVALHPAMGDFLSMSRNQKENAEGTIRPDENFARENLQLFTIGVHELNLDGTKKRDGSNNFIPTYDQKTIEEFAKVGADIIAGSLIKNPGGGIALSGGYIAGKEKLIDII